jgi:hypothetical protein
MTFDNTKLNNSGIYKITNKVNGKFIKTWISAAEVKKYIISQTSILR